MTKSWLIAHIGRRETTIRALLAERDRLCADLATVWKREASLHAILQTCQACIDPERHADINAEIETYLLDCEAAGCAAWVELERRVFKAEADLATAKADAVADLLGDMTEQDLRELSYVIGYSVPTVDLIPGCLDRLGSLGDRLLTLVCARNAQPQDRKGQV